MSESKHTPGPWLVDESGDVRQSRERSEEERRGGRCAGFRVAICAFGASDPSNGADARLIAAAPQMLEALREVVAVLGRWQNAPPVAQEWFTRARAAIAAATGGEQ